MKAEFRHLVEQGASLVELRIDYIKGNVNLERLLRDRPCPVVITCRRERDGGKWEGNEEARQMLLRSAIVAGVEYVDLEEDIAEKIPRYGKTKRIVSLHNFRETPENLEEIHARLAGLDADIVKIATMAHNPHDNIRMLRLMENATKQRSGCVWATWERRRVFSRASTTHRSPTPRSATNGRWRLGNSVSNK